MSRETSRTANAPSGARRSAVPAARKRASSPATTVTKLPPQVIDDQTKGDKIGGDEVAGDKIAGDQIDTQFNTAGAAVFLRAVQAQTVVGRDQITQYFNYSSLPIVWPRHSEEHYLQRVHQEFTALLAGRKPAAGEAPAWDTGFVQPLLSGRRLLAPSENGEQRTAETLRGTWSQIVPVSAHVGVLVGEIHSGRSFLMRWIAADSARRAQAREGSELPIYLPVSRFPFESAQGLLDAAAFACGQQPQAMRDCWNQFKRRIFLAIDDVDQLTGTQREAFLRALELLNDSRGEQHSIVVSCRPGGLANHIQRILSRAAGSVTSATQWIILPLDDQRIQQLLEACSAEAWLQELVVNNERLRWLVRHPATLLDFIRATRGLHLMTPPHNLAQLYQMFVDGYLFSESAHEVRGAAPRYHYGRVKQKLLAHLGFRMLASSRPNGMEIDDALCRELAARLEAMAGEFARTRRYMPQDWNVADALQELFDSRVVNQEAARVDQFEFASPIYRDYYAAVYLHDVGDRWQEAADAIRRTNHDDWNDALILLSGLPPREATNALLNRVLAAEPIRAADLWLEKGAVGFTKVPECVADAFTARCKAVAIPESLEAPVHAAVPYLAAVLQKAAPPLALQAVNGLMQLGIDAVDPLLDAAMACHPLVAASAVHALFHLGPRLAASRSARPTSELVPPLIEVDAGGFSFDNLGTCNAALGDVVLVQVPRTLHAEVSACFGKVDFDVFDVPSTFELWHTPLAWFAIDYFRRQGQVDWIGLAAACDTVARCAGLIVGKALRHGVVLQPIVEELSQCAVTYGRLGRCIASDLSLQWSLSEAASTPHELVDAADQIYKELRLFFNRANRGRMLGDSGGGPGVERKVAIKQDIAEIAAPVQAIVLEELAVDTSEVADLPSAVRVDYAQNVGTISRGGELRGIHVGRVAPVPFRAAEVYALRGRLNVETCRDAVIEGICIDALENWHGLRLHLELNVARLERAKITGVRVRPPAVAPAAAPACTVITLEQLQPLLKPLQAQLKKAPDGARSAVQQKIAGVQAQLLKGADRDDPALGRLIDDVLALHPNLRGAMLQLFAAPRLRAVAGPVTQFVLDKLRRG